MKLELVPIDGADAVTAKRQRKKKRSQRSRTIRPARIRRFSHAQQEDIKRFLTDLIIVIHDIQHEQECGFGTEGHEERLSALTRKRFDLFDDLEIHVDRFVRLLELAPVESAEEIELLLAHLRKEDLDDFYRTKIDANGIDIADRNPFLLQMEDDMDERQLALQMKCRLTDTEIEALLEHHSLENIVNDIIEVRRLLSGEFWRDSYYDL